MTVVRRAALVAALVLLFAGAVGCSSTSEGDDDQGDEQMQVEATEAALAALAEELGERPGIERAEATYDRSTGVALPSQLYVVAEVADEDPQEARRIVEEVTRATWDSAVPSISTLIVEVVTADDQLSVTTADVYGSLSLDRTELTERFGPRDG
jgi:hypothetical protein